MKSEALTVENDDLSIAWATAMLRLLEKGASELIPLTVTIHVNGDEPQETAGIRSALDDKLEECGFCSCETTANTIFPQSLWKPGTDRHVLYERYLTILPRLRKHKANGRGMYFERMISHGDDKVNQLEHIISTYRDSGNHRRSALQLSIFDPAHDHTNQRQLGFPCLQQVGFIPSTDGLTVTGFYPTQNIFDRAYGNYLGLCRLGRFVAHELDMKLTRLICFTGVGKIDKVNKSDLDHLRDTLRVLVPHHAQNSSASTNGYHEKPTTLQLRTGGKIHVGTR